MSLIKFQDYPNTDTPINSENLNYNFSHIVESGSNENGSWVKFADGTMICRHTITTNEQNTTAHYQNSTWNYPIAFIEIPTVIATPNNWSTNAVMIKVNPRATLCSVLQQHLNTTGTLAFLDRVGDEVNLVAIGKWKQKEV